MARIELKRDFPATRWSIIVRVVHGDEKVRRDAIEELCTTYWPPVYAFIQASGRSTHDAEDLTQSFFAQFLARNDFAKVDPTRGKLRTLLMVSVRNFLANDRKRSLAKKRQGGTLQIQLEQLESNWQLEPNLADTLTPELQFDREWAVTLLKSVFVKLGARYQRDDNFELWRVAKKFLVPRSEVPDNYQSAASELGMTAGALRVAVCRMRQRFREQLKREVEVTLGSQELLEDEIRYLLGVFSD